MRIRRREGCVEVETPAKLNLFLEVLGKRSDGFHDLETLMVPIAIRDDLRLTLRDDERVTLSCAWVDPVAAQRAGGSTKEDDGFPPAEKNLCFRGAELFRQRFGISRGVHLELRKRIPMQAGMGGGSSDAAATLLGMAALFDLRVDREEMLSLAAELGSDVPFFVDCLPAIARGRGERLEAVHSDERHMLSRMTFLAAKPPEGISTREAFAACDLPASPRSVEAFRQALRRGNRDAMAQSAFNRLDQAARRLSPAIEATAERFRQEGASIHALTGSGSARFAMYGESATARRHYRRLRQNFGGWTELARAWTPGRVAVAMSGA
ncbi:MAG TPA: 4-(cytidine 5'-diphospho)-2-C-methyl-D-erythritol kinase [Pirellulaceae bacterium]|jgi:4-diphosphocytidyl-2-C-methyl-D-erythritol kinase|nr:4-(cytidine 5'-diphospho)-2-C-methyl-D-erythritol kinase [Pirellulaceae bacterium]